MINIYEVMTEYERNCCVNTAYRAGHSLHATAIRPVKLFTFL